jgi:hypothetical protein
MMHRDLMTRVTSSLAFGILALAATGATRAQTPAPVLAARALDVGAPINIFNPAGSVHIIAWDRDSMVVRGRVPKSARFYYGGSARGVKFGLDGGPDGRDAPPCDLVVYVPRGSPVAAKSASAAITGESASGSFYSATGSIHLTGTASSVEAETISGDLNLDVTAPWIRARTGDGHLLLRGSPQDVDASTIGGTLDIASPELSRGRFASVTGDIHYVGAPRAGAILDFSNHSGAVELLLPRPARGVFDLSTVVGEIVNGLSSVRPALDATGNARTLRLDLGPNGGHVSVRTFKGAIRVMPQ